MIDASAVPKPPKWARRRRRAVKLVVGVLVLDIIFACFGGCADQFLLMPTTGVIPTPGSTRVEIPVPNRKPVEAFHRPGNTALTGEPDGYLLIFDGNGGRAENAITWGEVAIGNRNIELWSMNYPGFGGSPGSATLAGIPPAAVATFDAIRARAGYKPIVVWGASMGTTAALYLASQRPVAGLILTNPPPLRQLLMGNYGWWNLWLLAIPVSQGVPVDLDSIANASHVKVPAVFVMASKDTIVPPPYQQMVFDAYAGPKHDVRLANSNHNNPPAGTEAKTFADEIEWLWHSVGR